MRLYLVQHAEAKRREDDPSRPITERGLEDIRKVASYAKKSLRIEVNQIIHSGKLRAKQTAEVLSNYLAPSEGVKAAEGLEPLADPTAWAKRLAGVTADIMLVGHLPHLSKLTSQLLCGAEDREVVAFRYGGIVCLLKDESGGWALQWIVTPEISP